MVVSLEQRRKLGRRHTDEGAYLPSQEKIAEECAKIQEGWDETTRRHRAGIAKEMIGEFLHRCKVPDEFVEKEWC